MKKAVVFMHSACNTTAFNKSDFNRKTRGAVDTAL